MPSGVSYVLENRRRHHAGAPRGCSPTQRARPVSEYPSQAAAGAAQGRARADVSDPTVVVLTPGVYNSAYFEHTLLAREMGVELVEGRDLVCRNNRVSACAPPPGEMPVHVIYRRVDDDVPGPDAVPARLGARLRRVCSTPPAPATSRSPTRSATASPTTSWSTPTCPTSCGTTCPRSRSSHNVDTYRLEEPDHLRGRCSTSWTSWCSSRWTGPAARASSSARRPTAPSCDELRGEGARGPARLDRPAGGALSTVPTLIGDKIAPRHVDLRPFAVNDGDDVWVLPGGLTRVALPEGALVVNSSQGGGSKDTWVLDAPRRFADTDRRSRPRRASPPDGASHLLPPQVHHAQPGGPASVPRSDQQTAAAATVRGPHAEPDRRVAVLDRPLHRTRRRHRADPGHLPAADPRGRLGRGQRLPPRCSRSWGARSPRTGPACRRREVLQLLAYDRASPSSITGALAAARVNARSARDSVSSEMWEALNLTFLDLNEQRRRAQNSGRAPLLPVGARAHGAGVGHGRTRR